MALKSNFLLSVDLFLWYFKEVEKLFWHTYVLEVVLISVNKKSVSRVFADLLVALMAICRPEDWLFCLLICLEEKLWKEASWISLISTQFMFDESRQWPVCLYYTYLYICLSTLYLAPEQDFSSRVPHARLRYMHTKMTAPFCPRSSQEGLRTPWSLGLCAL